MLFQGETPGATRPGQRRDTEEGRGDGKVVFRGTDGNLSWASRESARPGWLLAC